MRPWDSAGDGGAASGAVRRNVRHSVLGETRAAEASSRIGTGLATPSDQCSRTALIIAITGGGRTGGVRRAGAGSARNVGTSTRR